MSVELKVPEEPPELAWEPGKKGGSEKEASNGAQGDSKPKSSKSQPRQSVFGPFLDPDAIKQDVKKALMKTETYSVFNFYKKEGIWQQIAKHPVFENVTLGVIAANAVYIAVDTDWNKDEPMTPTATHSLNEAATFFVFMEHAFCVYFTGEWIVRFMAFEVKSNGR